MAGNSPNLKTVRNQSPMNMPKLTAADATKGVIQMNARYAANTNANKMGSALAG